MDLFNKNQSSNLFAPSIQRIMAKLHIADEDDPNRISEGWIITHLPGDTLAVVRNADAFRQLVHEHGETTVIELVANTYTSLRDQDKIGALVGLGVEVISLSDIPQEKRNELFPKRRDEGQSNLGEREL